MEECQDGKMEEWKSGKMGKWKDGRMEKWKTDSRYLESATREDSCGSGGK
jgi:hypothetical protein